MSGQLVPVTDDLGCTKCNIHVFLKEDIFMKPIFLMTHALEFCNVPLYLQEMLNIYQPARPLRSEDEIFLHIPRTNSHPFSGFRLSHVIISLFIYIISFLIVHASIFMQFVSYYAVININIRERCIAYKDR